MSLAPGQKAKMPARLGVMRLGASRLGWYQPWIKVYIDGALAARARVSGANISDELNHEPNTADFRVSGLTPIKGQDVKIYCGDTSGSHLLFGGRILQTKQVYEVDCPDLVAWDCHCIDYTWLLNRRKVFRRYLNQSATAIILDLIASFSSGFTTTHVAAGLPTIDEITFTDEDLATALSRVMERVGGYWYVDYTPDIHAFLSETEAAGPITQALPRGMFGIQEESDLSQIATRVSARGGGSKAAVDVPIGSASLPIEDSAFYAPAGGTVESGPQRIAYTGLVDGSTPGSAVPGVIPPDASGVTFVTGVGAALVPAGTYRYKLSYVTAAGVTVAGVPTDSVVLGVAGSIELHSVPISSDSAVIGRRVYRELNGAGGFHRDSSCEATIGGNNTATDEVDNGGAGVSAQPLEPTVDGAGVGSAVIAPGVTALPVVACENFSSSGGWVDVSGQVLRYSGRSTSTGPGQLTGIPASGAGSIVTAIRGGSTVLHVPHLTGVSGIVYAINNGDEVNIVVTVDDVAAQTALAALVGGDGIHEMSIQDGRWSIAEATARATVELSLRKNPLVTVKFHSRDPTLRSGRNLTITLDSPAIAGTFTIQQVSITDLGFSGPTGFVFPLREVEASTRRYSFEDLLRRLKG